MNSPNIDRETDPSFTLMITAADFQGFSDSAQLNIIVLDVNDNIPIFEDDNINAVINEGQDHFIPKLVLQV